MCDHLREFILRFHTPSREKRAGWEPESLGMTKAWQIES
jgi:hypothetical protein